MTWRSDYEHPIEARCERRTAKRVWNIPAGRMAFAAHGKEKPSFGTGPAVPLRLSFSQTKPKKGDERQPVILTSEQIERLLNECEHHPMLKLWLIMNADTGMRTNSEPLWLQWQDVDLKNRKLHVVSGRDGHRTKTGKSRTVPITTERLLSALKEDVATYKLDIGGSPWVFHHVTTRRHHTRGERLNSLLHSFQNAAERAKLPEDVRPYDLRHTAITGWVKRYPAVIAQKAAGQASFKTTERYVHLNDEVLDVLIERPKPNERTG